MPADQIKFEIYLIRSSRNRKSQLQGAHVERVSPTQREVYTLGVDEAAIVDPVALHFSEFVILKLQNHQPIAAG